MRLHWRSLPRGNRSMLIPELSLSNQDHNVDLLGDCGAQAGSEWDMRGTIDGGQVWKKAVLPLLLFYLGMMSRKTRSHYIGT
jgi:hypothetical protein